MSTNMPAAEQNGIAVCKLDCTDEVRREQSVSPTSKCSSDRSKYEISDKTCSTGSQNRCNLSKEDSFNGLIEEKYQNHGAHITFETHNHGTELISSDSEKATLNFDPAACGVDPMFVPEYRSKEQNSSEMEESGPSPLAKHDKHNLKEFQKLKNDNNYEEGKDYGNSTFSVKTITSDGGVLRVTEEAGGYSVTLRVPPGAVTEPTDISMTVDWDGSGFSPTVRCGPAGTQFKGKVYICLPVYGKSEEIRLRKRETVDGNNEESDQRNQTLEWVENPDTCSYLATEDTCVIETDRFSDYEVIPDIAKYREFNLLVYVQQPAEGGRLCIRYYLTKNQLHKQVRDGERGLHGLCVEDCKLWLAQGEEHIITTLETDGLELLEHNPTRQTSEKWISDKGETGYSFLLTQKGWNNSVACLKFKRPGIPRDKCVRIELQKREALPYRIEAVLMQDRVERQDSPASVLCDRMVEELADVMDIREDSALELAGQIGMSTVRLNPDKVREYGGSRTRYVLRHYECLCIQKYIDPSDALVHLKIYLTEMKEERAADIVASYLPTKRRGSVPRVVDSGICITPHLSQIMDDPDQEESGTEEWRNDTILQDACARVTGNSETRAEERVEDNSVHGTPLTDQADSETLESYI